MIMSCMSAKIALLTLLLLSAVFVRAMAQAAPTVQEQIDLHSRNVQQYLREQRPDLAIPELKQLLLLDPSNVDAHGNLGVLLFFRGEFKDSIPQFKTAVGAQPGLWKIRALLGLAEGKSGDAKSGSSDLEAAFPHLNGEKLQTQVGEALIDNYTATGELEKAASVVSTLLVSEPTNTSLLYKAYRIYSDLAGKTVLTLALAAPESAQAHQVMAREVSREGDEVAAIANYRQAIKIDPRLPDLHSELGDLLYHSSNTKLQAEAEAEFNAALALNPRDEKAELMLGMIAEKRDDMKSASSALSRSLELSPNDGDACTELAKVLVSLNQPEKARQMFERAIQIDPTNFVAHYRLSTLYREEGKTDEAKQEVSQYLKYKQMREKLEKTLHDMRFNSHTSRDDNQDEP
jgi:tetratricopeptide (TPR) repeat protein